MGLAALYPAALGVFSNPGAGRVRSFCDADRELLSFARDSPWTGSCRKSRAMRRETGFTILEVLIAMVLLATAVAAVASLVSLGTQAGDAARRQTLATLLATQKMEQL